MSNQKGSTFVLVDKHAEASQDVDNNIHTSLQKFFFSKWYYYLLGVALFLLLAFVYIDTRADKYEVSSKILIKESDREYGSREDWLSSNLRFWAGVENVNNEVEVLTSFELMHAVIGQLGIGDQYYWKHNWDLINAFEEFPIKVHHFLLEKEKEIRFSVFPIDKNNFKLIYEGDTFGPYSFGESFDNRLGTFCIDRTQGLPTSSDSVMVVELIGSSLLAERYLKKLEVEPSGNNVQSSILQLKMEEEDPRRGVAIMRELIEQYDKRKFEEKNAVVAQNLDLIEKRLTDIGRELHSTENSIEQFKVRNDIAFETTSDLPILLENVNQLTQEAEELRIRLNVVEVLEKNFEDKVKNFELVTTNTFSEEDPISKMFDSYNALGLKRQQLLMHGKSSNPLLKTVETEIQSLAASIKASLAREKNELLLKSEKALDQKMAYQNKLRSIPKNERKLTSEARRMDLTEGLYLYLLKKKEELALGLADKFSHSVVIDPPRSSLFPVQKGILWIYIGALMAGFAFPFLGIYSVTFFRDAVQSENDLKRMVPEVNFMGIISKNTSKEKQIVVRQRNALITENFRFLRTKIQFQANKDKCLMVTSSSSAEGKTFIAMNLAASFALTNKSTIIVDFDLHKPELTNYMEVDNSVGMTDYLIDAATIEDICQPSPLGPHLNYIGSGQVLHNPGELITQEKLDKLFAYLKANYEYVIVDTPPVGIISDAFLLNNNVSQSLYVIRAGFTKRKMVENAQNLIDKKMLPNPSFVLNGVDRSELYGYGYNRYKRYAV